MADSLDSFDADLAKFAQTVGSDLNTVVRKISFDVFRGVVRKTPVDTGRLRAGWGIQLDKPGSEEPGEEGPYLVPRPSLPKDLGPFPTVYVYNNLPYAVPIENGGSDQAPEGMVAVTLAEVNAGLLGALE